MPRSEDTVPVHVPVSKEARETINHYVREKLGIKSVAEYIRRLIADDMQAHGEEVPFEVEQWGGDRTASED